MVAVLVVATLASANAAAQTLVGRGLVGRGPPAQRLVHRNLVAIRANPVGLLYDGRLAYRLRLYQDDSLALRDNFAGAGLAATVSPAFLRAGPVLEIAPASFATVWSSLQYARYFGTFDLLQSFPSPRSDFSDEELERRGDLANGDPLRPYAAGGWELSLGLDLQARAGQIAVRSQSRLVRADLDLREGDRTYYDQFTDLLMPDRGWSFINDLDAVFLALDSRLVVGLRYTASLPLYPESAYSPGDPEQHDNATQRLGPLAAYSFFSRDGSRFNAPTLLLVAQWWLDHRYRTGEETSQAVPLVGLAFRFHGDLIPFDAP